MTGLPGPDRSLGYGVVAWIESRVVIGPGDAVGKPMEFTPEELRMIVRAYEIVEDETRPSGWRRRRRRVEFSRRKGFRKSTLGAALAWAEFDGPSKFAGFDDDGNVYGQPPATPDIHIFSTTEEQAEDVGYSVFKTMIAPAYADQYRIGATETTRLDGTGSVKMASSAAISKDGGRPTFVWFDETHLFITPELHRLYSTVRRNTAKLVTSDPWILETTTAYAPGDHSIAELAAETATEDARLLAAGEIEDTMFLRDYLGASTKWDLDDDKERLAAIREASGAAWDWTNVAAILQEWRDASESEFRRFWLNQPFRDDDAPIDVATWDGLQRHRILKPGEPIVLGFDGSLYDDWTVLAACTLDDTPTLVPLGQWFRPASMRKHDWEVPSIEVDRLVRDVYGRYDVKLFYADPPYWQLVIDTWAQDLGDTVVKWETRRPSVMAPAFDRFMQALRAGEIFHNGDPDLRTHAMNVRLVTSHGYDLPKKGASKIDKMDYMIASTLAHEAMLDFRALPVKRKTTVTAY